MLQCLINKKYVWENIMCKQIDFDGIQGSGEKSHILNCHFYYTQH